MNDTESDRNENVEIAADVENVEIAADAAESGENVETPAESGETAAENAEGGSEEESGSEDDETVKSIIIPVRDSDQYVEVYVDELPEDVNDVMDVLRAELAPLDVWLEFAVEYYKQGMVDGYHEILNAATAPGVEEFYKDEESKVSRLKIFNSLAGHYINLLWNETDDRKKDSYAQEAIGYFQRADRIDAQYPMTLVGKSLVFLAKGDDERADRYVKSVLHNNGDDLPALLSRALLMYKRGKFEVARELYAHVIRLIDATKEFESKLWVCYGMCCYRLGCFSKADTILKHAADLDQSNVNAIMARALSILRRQNPREKWRSMQDPNSGFMSLIHRAHLVDASNPQVLNHLANHLFLQWHKLPGTFNVVQGSKQIICNADVSMDLKPGQFIRIGQEGLSNFTTHYIDREEQAISSTAITLDFPYGESSAADVLIYYKSYDKVLELAGNAFHNTQSNEIKAESCFYMGRVKHAQRMYEDAFRYYYSAVELWPEFSLAWYGLAQTYYEKKDYENAAIYVDKVIRLFPDFIDALMLNAKLLVLKGNSKLAISQLKRISELQPGNSEALIHLAEIHQSSLDSSSQTEAIAAYRAAEKVLRDGGHLVPIEFYLNMAVLYQAKKDYEHATKCYREALDLARCTATDDDTENAVPNDLNQKIFGYSENVTQENITILYNIALMHDELGERTNAKLMYEKIVAKFPFYIDCWLLIGNIYLDKGDTAKAIEYYDKALKEDPTSVEACLLASNAHMKKRQWSLSQKRLEHIMGKLGKKNDPYTLLSMGNIFVFNLGDKREKNLEFSASYFRKVLELQPKNLYAANGLGIVFAESGNIEAAKQVFSQVREACPEFGDVWVNLAHCYMSDERYAEAIQLYRMSLVQCYNWQDVEVMLYLARAYYENKNYEDCMKVLIKALRAEPSDTRCYYNLGLAQEEYAVAVLTQKPDARKESSRTVQDVENAIVNLNCAKRNFMFLVKFAEQEKGTLQFDKVKAGEHVLYCTETLSKADAHLEHERVRQENRERKLAEQKERLREIELKEEAEKREHQQKELEIAKKRQEIAEKTQSKLEQLKTGWELQNKKQDEKATTKRASSKKRKMKKNEDFIRSDESSAADSDVPASPAKKRRLKRNASKTKKKDNMFDSSDDDDDNIGSDTEFQSKPTNEETTQEAPPTQEEGDMKPTAESTAMDDLFGSDSD